MSQPPRSLSVPQFRDAKQRGEKLAMGTAYDALWAGLFDAAGVDSILVGDSAGSVVSDR